jgi:hypothetical protein
MIARFLMEISVSIQYQVRGTRFEVRRIALASFLAPRSYLSPHLSFVRRIWK